MIQKCSTHGLTPHKVLRGPIGIEIDICTVCASEREADEKESGERDKRLLLRAAQADTNARLQCAMIAPRFQDATLENFKMIGQGQGKALVASQWLLDNLDSGTPGLIFIGKNGTGKNHLASGIVRKAVQEHGKTALITKVRRLDRTIKEAWRKDGLESEAIKSFSAPDLLVIDEVGLQRGSETEILHLAEIIDDRYEAKKPTILCGNVSWPELQALIGDRAADRFREGGKIVVFDWESYRGKK